MIFPIGDDQVQGGHFPLFAYAFIALNVLAFFYQLQDPNLMICEYGSIPADVMDGQNTFTLFTSMFMHGGWMHLIGNMLFLWVFGDNIEATIGSPKFVLFYIGGGLAASAAHIFLGTSGATADCCMPCQNAMMECAEGVMCAGSIPTVGASGAISAVLGAYLIMFPKSRVKMLVIYFFRSFHIPAFVFLGFWIAQQLFSGFMSLGGEAGGGVAWWAHIGGFVFGLAAGFLFKDKGEGIFFEKESGAPTPETPYRKDDFL